MWKKRPITDGTGTPKKSRGGKKTKRGLIPGGGKKSTKRIRYQNACKGTPQTKKEPGTLRPHTVCPSTHAKGGRTVWGTRYGGGCAKGVGEGGALAGWFGGVQTVLGSRQRGALGFQKPDSICTGRKEKADPVRQAQTRQAF